MLKHKFLFLLLNTAIFGSLAHPAMALEDTDARRAILELRSQLKQASQNRLELAGKIQTLQQQVTQLRGQIEILNNKSKPAANTDDFDPNPQVGDPNEQQNYDQALDLFRQGKYAQASQSLRDFTNQYPNSPLVPIALFYEGSSCYASRDFSGAITGLQYMIQRFPKDPKAGDALLVIAGSQLELNDIKASKETLQRIIREYPNSPASDTAYERLKMYK